MSKYIRTPILSFDELTEAQKDYATTEFDWCESLHESSFVPNPCNADELLHMDEFLVLDSPMWDAGQMCSAFSGYFIKVSHDQSEAVVAYRHW